MDERIKELVESAEEIEHVGDIKHKAHYAKQKLAQAAEELGWEVVAISSKKIGGKEYIEIEVDF